MSTQHFPAISTTGLTLCYDMANVKKSFIGAPTTNLLSGNLQDASDIYARSTKTVYSANEVRWVNNATGTSTIRLYCNLASLTNGNTYGLSVYVKDVSGTVDFDWCDVAITGNNGISNAPGRLTGTASRATYDSTYRFLDINISSGGAVTLYNPQVDSVGFVTSYIDPGTSRSGTQVLLDMTGNYTITANSLSYGTDNTFSISGSDGSNLSIANVDLRTNFTLECWAYLNALQGGFFGHGTTSIQQGLHITCGSGTTRFGMYGNDTDFAFPHQIGVWAHYVFTYDHTSYVKKAYRNGVEYTGTPAQAQTAYTATPNILRVGQNYSSYSAPSINGKISAARLYTRVLNAAEVKQNFNAYRGRYNL